MNSAHDLLRENFERWEIRGRGLLAFPGSVSPRPPFIPFPGHRLNGYTGGDDGVRPTMISSLLSRLVSVVRTGLDDRQTVSKLHQSDLPETIEPHWRREERQQVEIALRIPKDVNPHRDVSAALLGGLALAFHPVAFEILGTHSGTICQLAADPMDSRLVHQQIQSLFPSVKLATGSGYLNDVWAQTLSSEPAIVEFALDEPFMMPLGETKGELFTPLIGGLGNLGMNELGLYQVIFTPANDPWAKASMEALCKADGKPYFDDLEDLAKAAQQKLRSQLFGVVVRLAARADEPWRAWEIIRGMAPALRSFSRPGGNRLVPLRNEKRSTVDHEENILRRTTNRCGMLLNLDELAGLVHIPSTSVQSPHFVRSVGSTREAPIVDRERTVICLGVNLHEGNERHVWLSQEQRVRHCHVIGGTGTGKSTLLFSMIRQDIEKGGGIAVLDPHGDLIDRVLEIIPPSRSRDVVLFDPSDEQFVLPFNILSAHSEFEKHLLASDLVSVFQRLSTSWGDQMNSVFQNAVLAFLESSEGGTLADLRRFLVDASWRDQFLQSVTDPDVRFYWKRSFPQLGSGRSIGPILTRLETFLSPKPIRYMVSQRENRLDFSEIMDSGKILLVKLPQGQIGRENAFLLGSLVMTKLQQMAMSRARMPALERRPFFCYIDEFQHFITPSMTEILSGARKYGLGLVLAHQELRQLARDQDVASAVLSNAQVRIVFRVGDSDAKTLADGFSHFEATNLQSLAVGQAICRIERADHDFNLTVEPVISIDPVLAAEQSATAIFASRTAYTIPRAEVEAELLRRLDAEDTAADPSKERRTKKSSPAKAQDEETSTVSEAVGLAPPPASAAPSYSPAKIPPPPLDPGKGGHQHRILQDRIRAAGEGQGFRAMLEMQIGTSRESVDVGLIRSDLRIACEISVTTTIDHEVGNVRKCLRAGFDVIAVITANEQRLKQIELALLNCMETAATARVKYFHPDGFLQYLSALPPPLEEPSVPSAPLPTETVRKGWRVKRAFTNLTPEERELKEDAAFRLLSEEMRLPPPHQSDE